ncbi:MAG: mercuric transporter MerT family protein [Nitrospinales bacterium]
MDKKKITGIGALIAAGIGSICCIGPIVLAALGFGAGALSFARGFGVLHMPMMLLAFVLLGAAFYFHYKKKEQNNTQAACCEPVSGNNRKNPAILWFATVLTIFLFLVPYII